MTLLNNQGVNYFHDTVLVYKVGRALCGVFTIKHFKQLHYTIHSQFVFCIITHLIQVESYNKKWENFEYAEFNTKRFHQQTLQFH